MNGLDAFKQTLFNGKNDLNIDWIYSKDNYTKVDIDSYPGSNKIQKFELLLANYSTN
jgi:hypothetical protein